MMLTLSTRPSFPRGQQVGKRFALNVLHGEEMLALVFADVIDLNDIGMKELGGRGGFRVEPADEILRARKLGRQDFDGHRAVQGALVTLVDLPMPPWPMRS